MQQLDSKMNSVVERADAAIKLTKMNMESKAKVVAAATVHQKTQDTSFASTHLTYADPKPCRDSHLAIALGERLAKIAIDELRTWRITEKSASHEKAMDAVIQYVRDAARKEIEAKSVDQLQRKVLALQRRS